MILYPFLFLLLIGVLYIVGVMLLRSSQDLVILWGQIYTVELSSFTLIVALLLLGVMTYLLIATVITLFAAPKRIAQRREKKQLALAHSDLKNGLVNLVEGHWSEAEKLLKKSVADSDTPLLNYLGCARAAHMSQQYHKRDEYLKTASAYGEKAEIAIAVSHASMQYESGQIEQARATLIHLIELSPNHPYPNQLLAKVYYKQEDWKQLLQLLPDLSGQETANTLDTDFYLRHAVNGVFESASGKQDLLVLESIWQQLPEQVHQQNYALEAYCKALMNAGGGELAAPLLEQAITENLQADLIACYGLIQHRHPQAALDKALSWEPLKTGDPVLMLCLARLANQSGSQSVSADYYERALTLVPDQRTYYEFAELLREMGDEINSQRCFRQGLRYCVQGKAIPFERLADEVR